MMADVRAARANARNNKREIVPNNEEKAEICAENDLVKVSTTLLPDDEIAINLIGTSEEHLLRHLDRKFIDLKSQIINELRTEFYQSKERNENERYLHSIIE